MKGKMLNLEEGLQNCPVGSPKQLDESSARGKVYLESSLVDSTLWDYYVDERDCSGSREERLADKLADAVFSERNFHFKDARYFRILSLSHQSRESYGLQTEALVAYFKD